MVSLDRKQRAAVFSFWRRVFLCLIAFSFIYLGLLRPLQRFVTKVYFGPFVEKFILKKDNYYIETAIDEIDLIRQNSKSEIRAKFELPFNGHILFALTLLIAARNKEFIRILVFYQLVLLIILPLLGLLFLNGQLWLAIILKFHEKAHKIVFIILGVLSIKSAASGLSIKKS